VSYGIYPVFVLLLMQIQRYRKDVTYCEGQDFVSDFERAGKLTATADTSLWTMRAKLEGVSCQRR
jgi:hypothetical protein